MASGPGGTTEHLERTEVAGMENYLDKSDGMKVENEEFELLMDPEESEVCLRYILTHARRRGSRTFDMHKREKLTTWWQAETGGWSAKERGSRSQRGCKAI